MLKMMLKVLRLLWKAACVVLLGQLRRLLGRLFVYWLLLLAVLTAIVMLIAC